MVDLDADIEIQNAAPTWFNDVEFQSRTCKLKKAEAFPIENIVAKDMFLELQESFQGKRHKHRKGVTEESAEKVWMDFIQKSIIPQEYKNGGLCYAGYILDCESWCLPSWIWINATVIRLLCTCNIVQAQQMADKLLHLQCECGGWIVRNDYTTNGIIPMLAPNDSAYLANNALLSVYKVTNKSKYLISAEKCADWILSTSRQDGLVWVGMNAQSGQWIHQHNIVDIGFTAGLFAELYTITGKEKYKQYLEKFITIYIRLFKKRNGSFATGLNEKDEQIGGAFSRGQAWALEGLIPAYCILKSAELRNTINCLVSILLKKQKKSGAWSYNLDRPLLGLDCKATPVIGLSLIQWYPYSSNQDEIKSAVQKAIKWCLKNTICDKSDACGGIFAYCMEGAIVHHLYTSTAFVYSSAYAIEMIKALRNMESINDISESKKDN